MQQLPQSNEIYRHFKGNEYKIIALAEHSETGETLVIYQAMYGEGKIYARPIDMFLGKVDKEKYPEATQEQRFELVSEEDEAFDMDPLVLSFLEAETYEERLNILEGLHHRITDDMINVMAMATDIEIKPQDVEERYTELKNCLQKLQRFEGSRLR